MYLTSQRDLFCRTACCESQVILCICGLEKKSPPPYFRQKVVKYLDVQRSIFYRRSNYEIMIKITFFVENIKICMLSCDAICILRQSAGCLRCWNLHTRGNKLTRRHNHGLHREPGFTVIIKCCFFQGKRYQISMILIHNHVFIILNIFNCLPLLRIITISKNASKSWFCIDHFSCADRVLRCYFFSSILRSSLQAIVMAEDETKETCSWQILRNIYVKYYPIYLKSWIINLHGMFYTFALLFYSESARICLSGNFY